MPTDTATSAGTAPATSPQEGLMSTTTRVICPASHACCAGKCGGEEVTATFTDRQVTVEACGFLQAQGWTGPGLVLTHNQALTVLTPATVPVTFQHAEGLGTFR